MSGTRNFALDGVASDLQLGKGGPRLKVDGGVISARNAADNAFARVKASPATEPDDVVILSQLSLSLTGFGINLGDVAQYGDGSWSPGAVALTDTTSVSEAVDRLNEILFLLVPKPPTAFPSGALTHTSVGNSPRLVTGFTDNTGGVTGLTSGSTVTRITAATISTNTFDDNGPGNEGTVTVRLNGNVSAQRILNGTSDNGTYASGLIIADQKDFPVATPGFWKSIDISVAGLSVPTGVNRLSISHSAAGTTPDLVFVRDSLSANCTFTAGSVTVSAQGTLAYSSSVPHFDQSGSIAVGLSIGNLAGQTYYGGSDPMTISGTNSIFSSRTVPYGDMGITVPIAANTTAPVPITPVVVNIDGNNIHNSGTVQVVLRNVNGSTAATNVASTLVLVKRGTAGSRVDEMAIPVTGLGTAPNGNSAQRLGSFGNLDNPAGNGATFTPSALLPAQEAAVVAGVLRHDVTNYSTGYVPPGPDFSAGRAGAQYFTFSFQRASVSTFKITVSGTYAGCWIKLPGISDNASLSPNGATANGWWDAMRLYDGIGIPGKTGDTQRGCALGTAMTGSGTGTFTITFGTASSTDATGNNILVRFRLNTGQSITSISISN